jgi:hypothetical protein
LISRKEAVAFSGDQLDGCSSVYDIQSCKPGGTWHYGKMEIQELLDYIYGVNSNGDKIGEKEIKKQDKQGSEA